MPKVAFIKDFDFSPKRPHGHITIAYKAGMKESVTRECVAAAKKAGVLTDAKTAGEE